MNKNIAKSLGMEIPEDTEVQEKIEEVKALSVVKPHEIAVIDNPELPDMTDIDIKLEEGEKQLEEIIISGLVQMKKMFEQADSDVTPDKRARFLEVAQMMMAQTFTAVAHKTKLQLEKKKMRMSEKSYSPENKDTSGVGKTTNNLFLGTREDALAMIEKTISPVNTVEYPRDSQ